MKVWKFVVVGMALWVGAAAGYAQERGYWVASSNTARSITGDMQFGAEKITINFATFTLAQIRTMTAADKQVLFPDAGEGAGNLYRVQIPAGKKFLHKNTLCGGEETDWVVTWVSGKELLVAMFSGGAMPKLTAEEMANSQRFCGVYTYVKG